MKYGFIVTQNISSFYAETPVNELGYSKTLQIEVGIASFKPRNLIVIIFDAKKYGEHSSDLFRPQNITFCNIIYNREILDLCAFAEFPLGL